MAVGRHLSVPSEHSCRVSWLLVDLVGAAEVADMLGVTRQQVDRLAKRWPDFPEPVAVLEISRSRIWRRRDIERWMTLHPKRRPGPPEKPYPPQR